MHDPGASEIFGTTSCGVWFRAEARITVGLLCTLPSAFALSLVLSHRHAASRVGAAAARSAVTTAAGFVAFVLGLGNRFTRGPLFIYIPEIDLIPPFSKTVAASLHNPPAGVAARR